MENKYGIKETKEALAFAFSLGNALSLTMEDGKISIWELPNFLSPFLKMGAAFEGIKSVPQELKELSHEEIEEIKAYVKENFNLKDDNLEANINEGLAIAFKIVSFVEKIAYEKV